MQIIRDAAALGDALKDMREGGLALVPTMGALHAGHLDLITASRRVADRVIATIFVNPLQFNDPADLDRYPRTEEEDIAKLRAVGCDALWIGSVGDLYPDGFATTVSVSGLTERWEGAHRPGHFDGVATIVAKLFIAVMPHAAIFGEKDWQQLAVIRRMTADLGLSIAVHGTPTVREHDGLAMSSRNANLGADERSRAVALPRALGMARDAIRSGAPVGDSLAAATAALTDAGFGPIDYLALVEGATLEPLDVPAEGARLIAAASIGATRLIDNLAI